MSESRGPHDPQKASLSARENGLRITEPHHSTVGAVPPRILRRWNVPFLLALLLLPIALGLNVAPVEAQTASMTGVDSPSIVRPGETFSVKVHGTYETSDPMDLHVTIIQRSDSRELGLGVDTITPPEGIVTEGDWSLAIDLEAYSPGPGEYDGEGRYSWPLMAVLHGYGNMEFTVTITRPDSDPHMNIMRVYAANLDGEEVSEVYVGSLHVVHFVFEYSVPADSMISIGYWNSLRIYGPSDSPGADGWVKHEIGTDHPVSDLIHYQIGAPAPLDPADEWLWQFRASVETLDGRSVSDEDSLTIPVLEREDRWAEFMEVFYPVDVPLGENFVVDVHGVYVFPGESTGDLQIEITHVDGAHIAGGETQTIPDLRDRGPFSQVFTLTAPGAEGILELVAVLRFSGNPERIDEFSMIVAVSVGVVDDYYCRITSVDVNGGEPPQDVTYGTSFTVDVHLSWNLPEPGWGIFVDIWDWDRLVFPIAFDILEMIEGGEGSTVLSIEIPGGHVPPRNGVWTLRATATYSRPAGPPDFTPDGHERIFEVNVVGAEEGVAGGTSDWAVTEVWASPVDPFLGAGVTFTARIEVITAAPVPQTVGVSYSLDGVEQSRDDVTYDEGMLFLMVTSQPWTPTLGEHKIRWEVDPDRDYDDPNRANNVRELTFSVTETPPLPEEEPPAEEEFDFYVTAVPSEQTISSPAIYTVTINATAGTPQPVQLDLIGAPAGASYLFDPPSGMPGYTSTLTITTATNVPAGVHGLTIRASGAGKERYKPITLKVERGPDYSLSITPNSVHAKPGEKAEFTVSVTSDTGYSQFVNLMISGVPDGATVRLEPPASTPTFQSTLTLELSKDVRPGFYRITVTGSGVEGKRATVTLQVEGEAGGMESRETTVDYLATAILGLIVAAAVGTSVFAIRRLRTKRATAFCIECGGKLTPGTEYCPKCGAKQSKNV